MFGGFIYWNGIFVKMFQTGIQVKVPKFKTFGFFFCIVPFPRWKLWDRQLLRCVLHAMMSTSFIFLVPVRNPCFPNGRRGHVKNRDTPSLKKKITSKMKFLCLVRLVFGGNWFLYFDFTYCLGGNFIFSVERLVKEVHQIVHRAVLSSKWCYGGFPLYSIVLLTLALRTAEWFILAVGSQDMSGLLKRHMLATGNRNNLRCSGARFGWQLNLVHLYFVTKSDRWVRRFHTIFWGD